MSKLLTNETLVGLIASFESAIRERDSQRVPGTESTFFTADAILEGLAELRDRRAADLTDEERDALAWAREQIRSSHWPPRGDTRRAMEAIVTIDKLIGGKS